MNVRRSGALARNDLRILRSDPALPVILTIMPLLVMAFITPAFGGSRFLGAGHASGAVQTVPGIAVMFSFFLMGNLAFGIFREHGWNTWERLRASDATLLDLFLGKTVGPFVILILQLAVMIWGGGALNGLHVAGSQAALALMVVAMAACLVALGSLWIAICNNITQLNAVTNLGAMVFAGLGGAITPLGALPGWAKAVAPATPTYWAMRGFQKVIIHGAGIADVARPIVMLLGFALLFLVLAGLRFQVEETKVSYA